MLSALLSSVKLVRRDKAARRSAKTAAPFVPANCQINASSSARRSAFDHILSVYGNSGSEVRRASMEQIISSSVEFINSARREEQGSLAVRSFFEESLVDVTNRSYSILESCALELNEALGATELSLSCTPPSFVNETLRFDRLRRPLETVTTFRGRVSSSAFSVVIRGKVPNVDFLLIPADKAVGLTKSESDYQPLMRFTGVVGADCIAWEVEGKPLSPARLEKYCIEVFKYFVEETQAQVSQSR